MSINTLIPGLHPAFCALVDQIIEHLAADDFRFDILAPEDGETPGFRVILQHQDGDGVVRIKFGYLKDTELEAAQNPDISIGGRYNSALLARHAGIPVPAPLEKVCQALQHNYYRVGCDKYPSEGGKLRVLMVRGNWHPQVVELTQGVLVDVTWQPRD